MDTFSPAIFTAAIFVSLFFIDLFNYNYKNLPVHAITGIVCIMIVSALSQNGFHGTAWLLVASPFLFIIGSILIRDYRISLSEQTTLHPNKEPKPDPLTPYFM
jgi:hypothetical protein